MKKIVTVLLSIVVAAMLAGMGFVGFKLYQKYSEGDERANLYAYYELATMDQGAVMMDGDILPVHCRILNGRCYLNLDTVQQYLHNRFYYTEVSQEIRYTDARMVVVAPLNGTAYTSTAEGITEAYNEDYMIAIGIDGVCYIALDFIEKYVPVTHEVFQEPDRVVISTMGLCREMITVKKDTVVRFRAGVKSEILTDVAKGDTVEFLEEDGVEDWTRVATRDGLVGYIRNNRLGERSMVTGAVTLEYQEPEFEPTLMEEPIRMGFHGVYTMDANKNLENVVETAFNMNVISPTWFTLSNNEGDFNSLASAEYVTKAHEKGIQVWALIEDINIDVDTYQILADSTNRTKLITGIMNAVAEYDLDGINIDFEGIRRAEGPHFIQFLRELSIMCREQDVVLSVDNYAPSSGNGYYDYAEQGIIADYVVLMGYDEHWGGSGDPGSTASQPFVERSMDNLLAMVEPGRIIHALPFYTRLWETKDGKVTDKAVFMKSTDKIIADMGLTVDFDSETGQKYASAEKDGSFYQMWIEDADSMENKLKAVTERNLAGVAAWRLNYEDRSVWELIGSYIK